MRCAAPSAARACDPAGRFFMDEVFLVHEKGTVITQTEQVVAPVPEEDEVLETLAADYYSEELAMMDYYQYAY